MPRRRDWDDVAFRKWIEWSYARRLELWDANNAVTDTVDMDMVVVQKGPNTPPKLDLQNVRMQNMTGGVNPLQTHGVRFDSIGRSFQAEISKDQLKGAPSYDREQLANQSYAWPELADRYFSVHRHPTEQ